MCAAISSVRFGGVFCLNSSLCACNETGGL